METKIHDVLLRLSSERHDLPQRAMKKKMDQGLGGRTLHRKEVGSPARHAHWSSWNFRRCTRNPLLHEEGIKGDLPQRGYLKQTLRKDGILATDCPSAMNVRKRVRLQMSFWRD